jgi:hypothetical protein
MNQPIKNYFDENGTKTQTGDVISTFPNRQQRRKFLQKSEKNPLFGVSLHQHCAPGSHLVYRPFVQKVYNWKKNKFVTIIHNQYLN